MGIMGPAYTIKNEHFEGPLDLLLNLIEKRRLFINDISLAKIADEYISYVSTHPEFPLADTAQFVLIASTLVLIKSKSLLPSLSLTTEEQGNIAQLQDRLKEYQRIKELAVHIKERYGKQVLFTNSPQPLTPVFSPDESMTLSGIIGGVHNILANLPKLESLPKAMVKKVISLEEMVSTLTDRIKSSLKMNFKEFTKGATGTKVEVIVGFLALLELVKQGIVRVTQESHKEDIVIESDTVSVPSY